jgi:probable phosphoglycerate mutase
MHLGVWEGLTPDEVNDRYDKAYDLWRVSPTKVAIPQGETHDSFRERIRNSLSRLIGSSNGKDLAIVTHGGPIASLISDWLLADYDRVIRRVVIDNAGVTIVEFRLDRPVIRSINSTAHLQGLPVCESHLFTSKACP